MHLQFPSGPFLSAQRKSLVQISRFSTLAQENMYSGSPPYISPFAYEGEGVEDLGRDAADYSSLRSTATWAYPCSNHSQTHIAGRTRARRGLERNPCSWR